MRLADGGYFENSATSTVYDLLEELMHSAQHGPRSNICFVVLSIRYLEKEGPDPDHSGFAFGDPVSPIKCLLNTREARARFSRDQLSRFCFEASKAGLPVASEVVSLDLFGADEGIPLGWKLSSKVRQRIDQQLAEIRAETTNHPTSKAWKVIGATLKGQFPSPILKQ